ncbi:MAG: Peptidoglycan endopeptidase LytF [Candidatus Anoxychlamydiales bacterium]|nr:Peptidoglycan endopeptidase LytF [Candidatus Anoxychlamydiales bacterium]
MSRRDTIIISVLVNAALLAVLFTTAITKNSTLEEPKLANNALIENTQQAKDMLANNVISNLEKTSNVQDKPDIQKQFASLMEDKEEVRKDANENKIVSNNEVEKIVYKLPEIAKALHEKTDEKILENVFEITVRSGDSLERLARANHIKISDITNLNNLPNSFLRIGQKLLIPTNAQIQKINTTPTLKLEERKAFESHEFYIVKVGDNPYTIAIKHSMKPHELLKLNNLDEKKARRLKPGDKLRIR